VTDNGTPAASDLETITITVSEANTDPVLTLIGSQTGPEGSAITFDANATDSDDPAQTLIFSLDPGAPSGATINSSTGVFNWIPGETAGGTVPSVTVRVTDNGTPAASDFETITITVSEANTDPVLTLIGSQTGPEGSAITFDANATDSDDPAQTLTFSLGAGAPAGASIVPSTGVFTWTPTEAQGPGVYPVTVVVTDNGAPPAADSQVVNITISEVNQPPVAVDDSHTVNEDSGPNTILVLANDTDADLPANTKTVIAVTAASKGTAAIGPLGANVVYTPNLNAFGTDSFSYTVSDGAGGSDTAVVNITITAVPDVPVGNPDSYTFNLATTHPFVVPAPGILANDSDGDGPVTLNLTAVDPPDHGTLELRDDGSFTYTRLTTAVDYVDTFVYQLKDTNPVTTVDVTVTLKIDLSRPPMAEWVLPVVKEGHYFPPHNGTTTLTVRVPVGSDVTGMEFAWYELGGGNLGITTTFTTDANYKTFTRTINNSEFPYGEFQLYAWSIDDAGNRFVVTTFPQTYPRIFINQNYIYGSNIYLPLILR
jgi:hypothetical protein